MPFSKRAFGVSLKHLSALCKKRANAQRKLDITMYFMLEFTRFLSAMRDLTCSQEQVAPSLSGDIYPITAFFSFSLICEKSLSFISPIFLLLVFLLLSKILTCPKSAT